LDTGLFLDHRTTRQMVKEIAKEKRVLNLLHIPVRFRFMLLQVVLPK
jgi:hypothetical protein